MYVLDMNFMVGAWTLLMIIKCCSKCSDGD